MVDLISLSIVVPLFNERESLPDLLEQLYLAMQEKELRNLFTEPFCFEIIISAPLMLICRMIPLPSRR